MSARRERESRKNTYSLASDRNLVVGLEVGDGGFVIAQVGLGSAQQEWCVGAVLFQFLEPLRHKNVATHTHTHMALEYSLVSSRIVSLAH